MSEWASSSAHNFNMHALWNFFIINRYSFNGQKKTFLNTLKCDYQHYYDAHTREFFSWWIYAENKTHFPLKEDFFWRNITELIFFITRAINHSEVAFYMRFLTHWSHLDFIFIRISLLLMFLLWTYALDYGNFLLSQLP